MLQQVRSRNEHRYSPALQPQLEQQLPPAASMDLDDAHGAIWQAVRHLFPEHAMVDQADYGCIVVSWKLRDPMRRGTQFAAPVMIRVEPGLLLALWTCDGESRREIAHLQVEAVSNALAGYEPRSRVPSCGVIVLGE